MPSAALTRAAELFIAELDAVATEVADACRRELPAYSQTGLVDAANEVRLAFREHATFFMRAILHDRLLSANELRDLAALGRRRSVQGIPLHDLVAGYQIGLWVSLQHLFRALQSLGLEPAEHAAIVDETTRHALRISAQASGAIAHAYLNAQRVGERAPSDDHHPDVSWLERDLDERVASRRLASHGFAVAPFHVVCLVAPVEVDDRDAVFAAVAAQLSLALGASRRSLIVGRLGNEVAILIGFDAANAQAAEVIRDGITTQFAIEGGRHRVAVSNPKPRVTRAYYQARRVMTLLHDAPQLGAAMTYDDAMPYLVLSLARSDASEGIEDVLGPVLADPNGALLLETLEAYFACGGRSVATAAALHVHRQTLYERLERIQALTGRTLEKADERLRYQMALKALELFAPVGG